MALKNWENFFEEFLSDNGYWYIPKGLTVKKENFSLIKKRLEILKKYEGKKWSKIQNVYVNDLIKKKLFDRRIEHKEKSDNAAIGRMFKVVASNLGLAWINEDENIFITEVGNKIISSGNGQVSTLINNQIKKFQFYNPSFHNREGFTNIRLSPIYFLCEVINELNEKYVSKEEYILFISKKKNNFDVKYSVEQIEKYRSLTKSEQQKIISYLKNIEIDSSNKRRSSIYNTILLESPYALNFYASSGIFDFIDGKLVLSINKRQFQQELKFFRKNYVWIDFRTHKDWFYYYGLISFDSPIMFALEYYTDISDIENSMKIFQKAKELKIKIPELKQKEEEFKSVLVAEKILEDFLEKHINELEDDLTLVKNGRQYPTISGPIDLLAKDKQGNYVIIELKKGRVADKVIGQISRYASFIASNLTTLKKVRAIIVGKRIDKNLILSIKVLRFKCHLYEFDYKVKFAKKDI